MITFDFNRTNINYLRSGNDLKQIIDFPTRANATVDLIITCGKLEDHQKRTFFSLYGNSQ